MVEKDKIEKEYETQFLWSEPIEYKGILLHPVLCSNIQDLYASTYALLYDPLRYDSSISTLPRLYFLTDILNHQDDMEYMLQNQFLLQLFIELKILLQLVLKEQTFDFIKNKNRYYLKVVREIKKDDELKSIEVVIKAKDFDVMRQIILHQNGIDYDDTFIHEDIRKWIAEQEAMSQSNESPQATIEDWMEVFMLQMGSCNMDDFKSTAIRRFNRIVDKSLSRENYNIQMTASMSGLVTFKDKINHWMTIQRKNSIYDKYFKELK